jgi:hypothetical protein
MNTEVRTRSEAQRLCCHVVSRRRFDREGRIGLRWTGQGIGTPDCWLGVDGLHVAPSESDPTGTAGLHRLSTLADLAKVAGVDLDAPFSAGHDTPPVGDPTAPLAIDPSALDDLLAWFELGWNVLADTAAAVSEPVSEITLWPEHFDAAFVWDGRANVGASPGDDDRPGPYLYVGPWDRLKPGADPFWNASFGAILLAPMTLRAGRDFIACGIDHLRRA